MTQFKRIMIGIDFSQMDAEVIRYASFLCHYLQAEKVYFAHAVKDFDVPQDIAEKLRGSEGPVDEKAKAELQKLAQQHWDKMPGVELDFKILEGNPTEQLLRWAKLKDIDLLILGQKHVKDGSGLLAQRLASKVHSSVIFVPPSAPLSLGNILVPVDFSKNCAAALQTGLEIGTKFTASQIHAVHLYSVPGNYYKTGKTFEEFAAIMKGHAEANYQKFIKPYENNLIPIKAEFLNDTEDKPVGILQDVVKRTNPDLMIVGARGRTDWSALILGSFTTRVIEAQMPVPLLIVKDKTHNLSFLEALKII